jgi:tRNA G37 N-methylase Trm5
MGMKRKTQTIYNENKIVFKDWSQFFFGLWRNKLKNVVRKGVYHIFEFILNEPNKKLWSTFFTCPKKNLSDNNCLKRIKIKKFPNMWLPV